MKINRYIICIVFISILLICIGVVISVVSSKDNKDSNFNDLLFTGKIEGEHCVANLCIDTIYINYFSDGSGSLEFQLTNTDKVNAQIGGNFLIISDSLSSLKVYFDELPANGSNDITVNFSDEKIAKMKDYALSNLVIEGNTGI